MEIALAEQGIFLLPAKVMLDQAKEKAWEQKLNVFGTLAKFLMHPKRLSFRPRTVMRSRFRCSFPSHIAELAAVRLLTIGRALYSLAIQVHSNVMVESDNGQRRLGLRLGVFYTVVVSRWLE